MTFNKVRKNTLVSLIADGEKNHETVIELIVGLLLGQLYYFKFTFLCLQIVIKQVNVSFVSYLLNL